jgi:uncharacterized membrane protein
MQAPNYNYDKKRFEAFLDAILAIILTILVLELRIPEGEHTEEMSTIKQVLCLVPSFTSYIGSFLLIVGIWLDHHLLFLNLKHITREYILLNMFFILSISIVPFTTGFAGVHHHDSFAVALLFVNYVVMNLLFGSLYWFANSKGLLPKTFFVDNRRTARYSIIGITGLTIAIPLAYVNTYISFALGIIIFGGHLFKKK